MVHSIKCQTHTSFNVKWQSPFGNTNARLHNMAKQNAKLSKRTTCAMRLLRVTLTCIRIGSCLFGLRSWSKSYFIYALYAALWISDVVIFTCYALFFELPQQNLSIASLTDLLRYMLQMLTHLTVLVESLHKDRLRQRSTQRLRAVRKRLSDAGALPYVLDRRVYSVRGGMSVMLAFAMLVWNLVHTLLSWTIYPSRVLLTALYWHSMPSVLVLQLRLIEFIAKITQLEACAHVLRLNIDAMGEHNLRRVFCAQFAWLRQLAPQCVPVQVRFVRVMPPLASAVNVNNDLAEEQQLRVFKRIYGDMYALHACLNDCYGWSLCAFMLMYFTYFVVNSYWVVFALITQVGDNAMLIKNMGFVFIIVMMLWILCWHCQQCTEESREIGCIMFKLVKPLGNKSYNDLVTDFSLQTLHQRFVITAKHFFNLNLNLLGGMVAAIVTYLVILIQFMFAEKNKAERNLLNNMPTYTHASINGSSVDTT